MQYIGMRHTRRVKRTRVKRTKRSRRRLQGGSVHKLPNINTIATNSRAKRISKLKEFESKYDVFFIVAHGAILPTKSYTVPSAPETYILNLSASGCDLTHNERLERIFYGNTNDNSINIMNSGDYEAYFWNFLNPEYTAKNKPIFFNPNDPTANIEGQEKTAIYTPGEQVPDNSLEFINRDFFGGIGVFKVPIHPIVLQKKIKFSKDFDIEMNKLIDDNKLSIPNYGKDSTKMTPQEIQARNAAIEQLKPQLSTFVKEKDKEFINLEGNRFKTILERRNRQGKRTPYSMNLSELIQEPELQPGPGKKRLIILQTCRGFYGLRIASSILPIYKQQVRAASIGRRRGTTSVAIVPTTTTAAAVPTTTTAVAVPTTTTSTAPTTTTSTARPPTTTTTAPKPKPKPKTGYLGLTRGFYNPAPTPTKPTTAKPKKNTMGFNINPVSGEPLTSKPPTHTSLDATA